MPIEQVPGAVKTRRAVLVVLQVAAGAVVHVTVAQGSGLHWAVVRLQPKGHALSVGA